MSRLDRPTTPHRTDPDLLVLHTLRCIGVAGLPRVADAAGLSESDTESQLLDLAVDGLVTREPGEFGGWALTDAGRAADRSRIAAELDAAGTRSVVTEALDRFLVLNPELLDLCTAWQLRSVDGVPTLNNHDDPAYDGRVLARFADLHRRTEVACADLFDAMLRFRRYRERLADALARAEAGTWTYLTDDTASYHTVWCQLHEDLPTTLGLPRH